MKPKVMLLVVIFLLLGSVVAAYNLKTYYIYDDKAKVDKPSDNFKTYVIIQKTYKLPKRTLKLNIQRLYREHDWEEKEWLLEKKSKNWFAHFEGKDYYGFDEDLYGRKEFYLRWKND